MSRGARGQRGGRSLLTRRRSWRPARCAVKPAPWAAPVRRERTPRLALVLAAAFAVWGAFWALPSAASAATTRYFDRQLTGLTPPDSPVHGPFAVPRDVTVGPSENLWVIDEGTSTITELSPLGGYLSQIPGAGSRRLAVNRATGEIYAVAGSGANAIGVYSAGGALLRQIPFGYSECGEIAVAVDNSGGSGGPGEGEQGRLYVTYNCSVRGVQALSPNGSKVDFSASAGYIFENEITGTPAGEFESPGRVVATDHHGDIYIFGRVTGEENGAVYEFAPSGSFVRSFTGAEVPGGLPEGLEAITVDPTNGNLLVAGYRGGSTIFEFSETGKFLRQFTGTSESSPFNAVTGLAVSPSGYLYVADSYGGVVDVFLPLGLGPLPEASTEAATEVERNSATLHARAGLGGGGSVTNCRFEYAIAAEYKPWAEPEPYTATAPCLNAAGETVGTTGKPIEGTTALHALIGGIHAGDTFDFRVSLTNGDEVSRYGSDLSLETPPAVTAVETLPATGITNKTALLHGSYTGEHIPTTYHFEYTTEADFEDHGYGTAFKVPVEDAVAPEGGGEVLVPPLEATGLAPNTTYVYRLAATNKFGTSFSENQTFTTFQPPTIEGFFTSHVTATSADLEAKINPQGFTTECRFEYGTTTSYGSSVPCPEPLNGREGITVVIPIAGLESGDTYHFRVITESKWGVVTSEDQTFEFFPPPCPNAAIRNQTGTAYLPDCRAYELVSPPNADGTLLFAGGPNTGQATNPPRLAFTGLYGAIPGAETINSAGDLYVAARTGTGWVSHYVGAPGSQSACMGGPPNAPLSQASYLNPPYLTNTILTDPSMSTFLIWPDGTPGGCFAGRQIADTEWGKRPRRPTHRTCTTPKAHLSSVCRPTFQVNRPPSKKPSSVPIPESTMTRLTALAKSLLRATSATCSSPQTRPPLLPAASPRLPARHTTTTSPQARFPLSRSLPTAKISFRTPYSPIHPRQHIVKMLKCPGALKSTCTSPLCLQTAPTSSSRLPRPAPPLATKVEKSGLACALSSRQPQSTSTCG